MIAVWDLGVRLAWAGRGARTVAIVGGTAVATALLLTTWAIPAALYAGVQVVDPQERANVSAILAFSALPAAVLLLTATRASAAARDRRLAALRLIGTTTRATGMVAGVENGVLATAGATLGVGLFALVAPMVTALVAAGPGWFHGPLTTTPPAALATVGGVVVLTSTLAVISARSVLRDPLAGRSEATVRPISRRRLLLLIPPVALLGLIDALGAHASWLQNNLGLTLLVVGSISGAVAIAACTPLLARLLARVIADRSGPATLMAARAVETDAGSSGRLVAGLGITVYLVLAALAVLSAYEATPQYLYALQTIRQGPQVIDVWPAGNSITTGQLTPIDTGQIDRLADVPGVVQVLPVFLTSEGCTPTGDCPPKAFVGTCEGLRQVMTVTGCHDDQAGVINVANWAGTGMGWDPAEFEAFNGTDLPAAHSLDLAFEPDGRTVDVPLGPALTQDSAATQRRWVYQSDYRVFIPATLVEAVGIRPTRAQVIALGGLDVQQSVTAAAGPDLTVEPYPLWDYDAVMRVRTAITTLSALAVGIGLLSLAMTAADRAIERRRAVGRLIALGFPTRTLRTAQLLQVLAPLAIATGLAATLGALMARAFAALAGWPDLTNGIQLGLVTTATLIGAMLTAAVTVPMIRTRLTPDLLRRE